MVTEKPTYPKQSNNIARTHMPDDTDFSPLEELDRSEARIVVKLEFRRFRKPVTIIQGLPNGRLADIARELKQRFGAGGTTKGGELLLQGDHRKKAKDELVRLGFPGDHIDMI
jgi:translation initiation factor 1